jgi:hypothetical protein
MARGERFPGNLDVNQRDLIEKEPSAEGVTPNSSAVVQSNLSSLRQNVGASSPAQTNSSPSLQDKLANLKAQSPQTTPTPSSSPSLQDKLANLKAQSSQAAQANPAPSSPTAHPSRNR